MYGWIIYCVHVGFNVCPCPNPHHTKQTVVSILLVEKEGNYLVIFSQYRPTHQLTNMMGEIIVRHIEFIIDFICIIFTINRRRVPESCPHESVLKIGAISTRTDSIPLQSSRTFVHAYILPVRNRWTARFLRLFFVFYDIK